MVAESLIVPTLDTIGELGGKRVLVRVDFNSPVEPKSGKIMDTTRIKSHIPTIKELIDKGSAVVIISHQGRPGMEDFTTLEEHCRLLSELAGIDVRFVDDVIGPEARRVISNLGEGEVVMLDNIRLLSEEMMEAPPEAHASTILVRKLSPLFDIYVNDAFATAHRSHASIVGFPILLPSAAGRVMEREVIALAKIRDPSLSPKVYVLGGGKVRDTLRAVEHILSKDSNSMVLATGLLAILFLAVGGIISRENYRVLERKGLLALLPRAEAILRLYRGRIRLPIDFIIEKEGKAITVELDNIDGPIKDIGPKTIDMYGDIMRDAKVIVFKGPAGVIEDPRFREGTRGLIRKAAETGSIVILGGGHLNAVAEELKVKEKSNVHISTGGGALITFLSGEKLPAIEALGISAKKFNIKGVEIS